MKKTKKSLSSIHVIMLAFFTTILVGSILLKLPVSTQSGKSVSYIDALFTATTSTCVTGLVTVPTASTWNAFGQAVILCLIQIGGLGVITVISAFMIFLNKKIGIGNRMLISDSFNLSSLDGMVRFVKKIIFISFVTEAIGAFLYMTVFIPDFGARGIWISIFTSVSAFCNAGIDIIGENSLCDYALNPVVNITTMFLIIFGGIGFVVLFDIEKLIKNKKRKSLVFLSLHTKIVLSVTAILIVLGALLFFVFEKDNPDTIKNLSAPQKIMVSLFQSVTTRTAGFATIPQENLTPSSSFLSLIYMFIGGSPSGTAGGVKTVTVVVLIMCALSVIRNKRTTDIFNRQIPNDIIKKSIAVFFTSFFIVLMSSLLLMTFEGGDLTNVLYESVSATATVGLTRNFTATLNSIGKVIIIFAMYLGRIGPISLAYAFRTNKVMENVIENPAEKVVVG